MENAANDSIVKDAPKPKTADTPSNITRSQPPDCGKPSNTRASARIMSPAQSIGAEEQEIPPQYQDSGISMLESPDSGDNIAISSNWQTVSPGFNIDDFDQYSGVLQQQSIATLDAVMMSPNQVLQQSSKPKQAFGCDFSLNESQEYLVTEPSGRDKMESTLRHQQSSLTRSQGQQGSLKMSQGSRSSTPLHLATQYSQTECIAVLLEHNYDINAQDQEGRTVLLIAAQKRDGKSLDALLKHGADPTITDHDGRTPLEVAVVNGHHDILEILLQHGVRE